MRPMFIDLHEVLGRAPPPPSAGAAHDTAAVAIQRLNALYKDLLHAVKEEALLMEQIFPDPGTALAAFISRVFEQKIKARHATLVQASRHDLAESPSLEGHGDQAVRTRACYTHVCGSPHDRCKPACQFAASHGEAVRSGTPQLSVQLAVEEVLVPPPTSAAPSVLRSYLQLLAEAYRRTLQLADKLHDAGGADVKTKACPQVDIVPTAVVT